MKNRITPYAAKLISSVGVRNVRRDLMELKRSLKGEPHKVSVFLRILRRVLFLKPLAYPALACAFARPDTRPLAAQSP